MSGHVFVGFFPGKADRFIVIGCVQLRYLYFSSWSNLRENWPGPESSACTATF